MPARALLLAVALLQLGCLGHWQAQPGPPGAVLAAGKPDRVRVTLTDSTRLDLRRPTLAADSLSGLHADTTVTLPAAQVAHIAIRRPGPTATVRFFAAAGLVAMIVYFATVREPY
jgi:hypothetical protein